VLRHNCRSLWLRTMLALAYNFGFRKAELLNMRVRQVDLLNRFLTLDPGTTKNRDGRKVKLTNETFQLLCECLRGKQPDGHVFTWPSGEPVRDIRTSLVQALQTIWPWSLRLSEVFRPRERQEQL
jgi:integrase